MYNSHKAKGWCNNHSHKSFVGNQLSKTAPLIGSPQATVYQLSNVTGPAKMDQVGKKYIISQNGKYLEFCGQYLLSVSCKMLAIEFFSMVKISLQYL